MLMAFPGIGYDTVLRLRLCEVAGLLSGRAQLMRRSTQEPVTPRADWQSELAALGPQYVRRGG